MSWLARSQQVLFWVVMLAVAVLVYAYRDTLADALTTHMQEVVLLIFLNTALTCTQAANFLTLLEKPFEPPFLQTAAAWAASAMANYIAPLKAGLAVRMAYFKLHGITLIDSSTTTLRQLQLSIWVAVGIAGFALMFIEDIKLRGTGIALLLLFIAWPFLMRLSRTVILPHLLERRLSADNYQALAHALRTPRYRYLSLVFAQYLIVTLAIVIVYRSFGADMGIHEALLLSVLTAVTGLVALTPNNLGIQEALLGVVANMQGLSTGDAVSIAALFRMGHIINGLGMTGLGMAIFGRHHGQA